MFSKEIERIALLQFSHHCYVAGRRMQQTCISTNPVQLHLTADATRDSCSLVRPSSKSGQAWQLHWRLRVFTEAPYLH